MSIVRCPNNDAGRLRPLGRPTVSEGYFTAWQGQGTINVPKYHRYRCDHCGTDWTLDVERNVWLRGT